MQTESVISIFLLENSVLSIEIALILFPEYLIVSQVTPEKVAFPNSDLSIIIF